MKKNITINDWREYFPFDKIRSSQEKIINFTLNAFENDNKKTVIIEAPTGLGKSAIAITLSNYFKNDKESSKLSSYILTTQRILQEQYVKDYNIPKIWAKHNYYCKQRYNVSCQFGSWINKIFKNFNYCNCTYDIEKNIFFNSHVSITNTQYMLSHIEYEPQTVSKRRLLVVDECHNLENDIIEFVSLEINKNFLSNHDILWNKSNNLDDIFEWLSNIVIDKLTIKKDEYFVLIKEHGSDILFSSEGKDIVRKYDELEKYIGRLLRITDKFFKNEWVLSRNKEDDIITIKPIYASSFSNDLLFSKVSDKVLLMSSTILNKDTFCNNIGIDVDDCDFISIPSPFKVENRPVMVVSIASMSYKNINDSLPKMIKPINDIINTYHKKDKGIIHCSTYYIANYLYKNINNKRLLIHNSDNRIEVLNTHLTSSNPTILLSPSLTEGIDLIDNLSRFQIIVKVPFPYLGDNYILTKMQKIKNWYEWNTVKTLIQSSGRSIRTDDDYAYTYILDSDFDFFYKKSEFLFPEWFKNAIIKI